jgi:hypothetical protein
MYNTQRNDQVALSKEFLTARWGPLLVDELVAGQRVSVCSVCPSHARAECAAHRKYNRLWARRNHAAATGEQITLSNHEIL